VIYGLEDVKNMMADKETIDVFLENAVQDMLLPVMMLNIKHLKVCSVYIKFKF